MKNIFGLLYLFISSGALYFLIFPLLKRLKRAKYNILKYSSFPIFLLLFGSIFSRIGILNPVHFRILSFSSSYLLIFLFFLSLMINIRGRKITWLNIFSLAIPIIIVAILHQFGVLSTVFLFSKKPIAEIGNTRISILDILVAIIIFYISLTFSRNIKHLLEKKMNQIPGMERGRIHLISMITGYGIIIIGVFIAFSIVGINLTTLKVLLGALGVGIGFGLQTLVNNLISGFLILSDKSIVPGDIIEVDSILGTVENVELRATIVRTFNNVEIIIPNADLVSKNVINLTHSNTLIRMNIPIGVAYSSDPFMVREVLIKALSELEETIEKPPTDIYFSDFGDSSLNFTALIWTDKAEKKEKIESEARYTIWKTLKENNIEIPFPQLDLHIKGSKDLSTPNFSRKERKDKKERKGI